MNQILYKGEIFGGVGEDVTNKQYADVTIHNPITDEDETYSNIVGGLNAEIFNSYKTSSRNIATGDYSFITGRDNKELSSNDRNTITGQNNIVIGTNHDTVIGSDHFVKYGSNSFISGRNNKATEAYGVSIFGIYNTLIGNSSENGIIEGQDNNATYLNNSRVSGYQNTVEDLNNSFVEGKGNQVGYSTEGTHIFGAYNIVNREETPGSIYGGLLVCGEANRVKNGAHGIVTGQSNILSMNHSIIGGMYNLIANISQGDLIVGHSLRIKTSQDSLLAGNGAFIDEPSSSAVFGNYLKIKKADRSIITGDNLEANNITTSLIINKKNGLDIVAKDITNSVIIGENIYNGRNVQGIIKETSGSTKFFVSGFTSREWTYGASYDPSSYTFTDGYYVQYWDLKYKSNFDNQTICIAQTVKFYACTSSEWHEIQRDEISNYNYLGIVNEEIEEGSTATTIDRLTLIANQVSISQSSIPNNTFLQMYNESSQLFSGVYYYSNNNFVSILQSGDVGDLPTDIQGSLILGKNTKICGVDTSIVSIGNNQFIYGGSYFLAFGSNNTIRYGSNNYCFGDNNLIQGTNQFCKGYSNSLSAVNHNCFGTSNTFNQGSDNTCFGQGNTVSNGFLLACFGQNNTMDNGACNFCSGQSNNVINGSTNVIFGQSNTVNYSVYSLISGQTNNIKKTANCIVAGYYNRVGNDNNDIAYSAIFGGNNTFTGGLINGYNSQGTAIFGTQNSLKTSYFAGLLAGHQNIVECFFDGGIVDGYRNKVTNRVTAGFLTGQDNEVYDNDYSIICGTTNESTSQIYSSFYGGDNNICTSSQNSLIVGAYNTISTAYHSLIGGSFNTITNTLVSSLIIGYNHTINSGNDNSSYIGCIGEGLSTNGENNILLIGSYNAVKTNGAFIVGNGTNLNNTITRSNAFEVYKDGCQTIILKEPSQALANTLGIGKIEITQEKIKFTSLYDNSNNEKEIVEFTFEDLQSLKNIAPAQNINNTPFPQI